MVSPLWHRSARLPKSKLFRLFGISLRRFHSRNGFASLVSVWRQPPATDDEGKRIPNATMAVVTRELAFRLAKISFPPDAEHTPGIGHVLADRLSRVFAPGGVSNVSRAVSVPS